MQLFFLYFLLRHVTYFIYILIHIGYLLSGYVYVGLDVINILVLCPIHLLDTIVSYGRYGGRLTQALLYHTLLSLVLIHLMLSPGAPLLLIRWMMVLMLCPAISRVMVLMLVLLS